MCVPLCRSFSEGCAEVSLRGCGGTQNLIQSELLIESRKKIRKPSLDVLVQYFFRANDLLPNDDGIVFHGALREIAIPSGRNMLGSGKHQEDAFIPHHEFHFVLDTVPVETDMTDFFLRGKILQHFKDVIAHGLVDFSDDPADTLQQLAFFDVFPIMPRIRMRFFCWDQIQLRQQGTDPMIVSSFLIQWIWPHSFDFSQTPCKRTPDRCPVIRGAREIFSDSVVIPSSNQSPITI